MKINLYEMNVSENKYLRPTDMEATFIRRNNRDLNLVDDRGGGSWCRVVEKYVEIPRPNTVGNRVGDYVARVIDGSVGMVKGLLERLK